MDLDPFPVRMLGFQSSFRVLVVAFGFWVTVFRLVGVTTEAISSSSSLSVDCSSLALYLESLLSPYSFSFLTNHLEFSYSLSNAYRPPALGRCSANDVWLLHHRCVEVTHT